MSKKLRKLQIGLYPNNVTKIFHVKMSMSVTLAYSYDTACQLLCISSTVLNGALSCLSANNNMSDLVSLFSESDEEILT